MINGIAIFQLSYSILILSCWFSRSRLRLMAECGSCTLSPVAPSARSAPGGQLSKDGTSMLKSLLEVCPRAAKTALPFCWNLRKNTCRLTTCSSVFTRAVTTEHPSCAHSASWALRL